MNARGETLERNKQIVRHFYAQGLNRSDASVFETLDQSGRFETLRISIGIPDRWDIPESFSMLSGPSPATRFEFTPGWVAACRRPPAFA